MTVPGFLEVICPVCQEPVPEQGFRRMRIPWKDGRRLRVHAGCAATVEAQGTLAGADGRPIGERPRTAA